MFSFAAKRQLAPLIGQLRRISVRTIDECPRTTIEQRNLNELATAVEVESHLFDAQRPATNIPPSGNNNDKSVPRAPPATSLRRTSPAKPPVATTISYTKLGLNDSRLGALILAAKSRKARNRKRQLLIEGRRLIRDALKAGLRLETLLFAQKQHLAEFEADLVDADGSNNYQIIRVPQQDLRAWSTLTTCPGTIAIFQRPESSVPFDEKSAPRSAITVICDNIREPNNLGSIIRTCAAVPLVRVVVTKGCCDPWDTKSLRGGCGAQFHVPIDDDVTWERIDHGFTRTGRSTLVYLADNNLANARRFDLPIRPYTEMRFGDTIRHCVLVIGGETHGISDQAYRFSAKCNGELAGERAGGCLHIPMEPNVNSLNTASALTLLLFEMRRQFPALRDDSVCLEQI